MTANLTTLQTANHNVPRQNLPVFYLVKYSPNRKLSQKNFVDVLETDIRSSVCTAGVAREMVFRVFTTCSEMGLF
jgi:hypothetical protein